MHDDPLYQKEIFHSDWWFEWVIHVPLCKAGSAHAEQLDNVVRDLGISPKYPPGVEPQIREIEVKFATPPKLFVSPAKINMEQMNLQSDLVNNNLGVWWQDRGLTP